MDGMGALSERRICSQPGLCMPFQNPARLLRIRKRKNREHGGTCRSWPECRCIRAAGGNRICLVRQILPSIFPVFSPTDSNAYSMDFDMAYTSPAGNQTRLSLRWAHPGGRAASRESDGRGQRIWVGYLELFWIVIIPTCPFKKK